MCTQSKTKKKITHVADNIYFLSKHINYLSRSFNFIFGILLFLLSDSSTNYYRELMNRWRSSSIM